MGASCQGPKAYTGEFELKLDPNIELPQSIDVIKKNTISLAVPAPCFYRTRRFRFAGRSRAGYSGEDKPHINQDNLLYYNFRRLFLHIFIILDGNGPDGDLAVSGCCHRPCFTCCDRCTAHAPPFLSERLLVLTYFTLTSTGIFRQGKAAHTALAGHAIRRWAKSGRHLEANVREGR